MESAEEDRRPRRNLKAFLVGSHEPGMSRSDSISSLSTGSLTSILHHESYESGVSDLEDSYEERWEEDDTEGNQYVSRPSVGVHDTTFTKRGDHLARKLEAEPPRGTESGAEKQDKETEKEKKRTPKRSISSKFSYANWLEEKKKQEEAKKQLILKKEADKVASKNAEESRKREKAERASVEFQKWMAAKQERERASRRLESENQKQNAAIEAEKAKGKAERRSQLEARFLERASQCTRNVTKHKVEHERRKRASSKDRQSRAPLQFADWLRAKSKERVTRESLAYANGRLVRYYDGAANPPVQFRQLCAWNGVLDTNKEADAAYERFLEQRINDLLLGDS